MLETLKRFLGLDQPSSPELSPTTNATVERLIAGTHREHKDEPKPQRDSEDPTDRYFLTMGQMQDAIKRRDYNKAAALTRESLQYVPAFVRKEVQAYGAFQIASIPCLQKGGTMLALDGDVDGLRELRALVEKHPELEPWRVEAESHFDSLRLFQAIVDTVEKEPGCRQRSVKKRIGEEDGRKVATLIQWLDKSGRIRRVKAGSTYTLWLPGQEEAPSPPPDIEMPRLKRQGDSARVRELDLKNTPYVPLPRAPMGWEDRHDRPSPESFPPATEWFEVQDNGEWSINSVEKIPMNERPDTAYRRFFPVAEGVVMIDDLGKAKAFWSSPASALLCNRMGQEIAEAPLAHDLYRIGVNALGRGIIALSKDCVLHAYNSTLKPLFEVSLREAPEVKALSKRHEIEPDSMRNHLRTVSLAHDNSRFLVTGVDEAWCISADGKPLWSLRMPLKEGWKEVSRPLQDFGTSREIAEALSVMELRLPVSPTDVKRRYRELAKQWHPDLNPTKPGAVERMKALTGAAEILTGVDLSEERRAIGVQYEKEMSRFETEVAGFAMTFSVGTGRGLTVASDWIYAASFSGRSHSAYIAGYSGKIVQLDSSGVPKRVYDIGSVPSRIVDTGDYLYFLTHTRLYVLHGDTLHTIVDTYEGGDLIVAETGFALLEKKRVRWFREDGEYLGAVVTNNPIRRVYWSTSGLTVETRQRRALVSGAPAWWE